MGRAISEPTGERCKCGGRIYVTRVDGFRPKKHCILCHRQFWGQLELDVFGEVTP